MKKKQYGTIGTPLVKIDNSLDKYHGKNLAPKKLKEANETLKRLGLPKTKEDKKS
jgi:hypothetical protein